jgi:uncharacterized protein YqeY
MSLKETIRKHITEATKLRAETQKNVLKVVLGEIDTLESRQGKAFTDEDCCRVIKKTLQGVEEMLTYKPGDAKFEEEKAILQALLPQEMSIHDLKVSLTAKAEEIRAAKSEGQATGIAMKFFKENKIIVDGNLVKKVVAEIRT